MYLIWLTWQQEHAPQQTPQQFNAQNESRQNTMIEKSEDIPDAPITESFAQATENLERKPTDQATKSQKIRVKTDVLNVVIDTRGGDIRHLELPTYPVSLTKKDEPFQLLYSNSLTYIAQSGLRHDKANDKRSVGTLAPTHYDVYKTESTNYELADDKESMEVKLTWFGDNNIKS